jgi:hypothetical protein
MNERGQIVPLVALFLVALLGMSALAIDMGYYRYQQRLQQSATDAAAVAAASELAYSTSNADAAGYDAANTNGFATPAATVSIDPNYSDAFTSGSSGAVQVTITRSYPRFFGAFYSTDQQSITTTAVASLSTTGAPADCMFLLSDSSPGWSFAGVDISAPTCSLAMNCAPSSAGGTIAAEAITYSTCSPSDAGTSFPDASPTLGGAVSDPCPYITACAYLTNNPPSTSSCPNTVNSAGGTLTLYPGCYSSWSCAGCTITLEPGLYVFNTSVSCAGCTITGSGVTLYAASGSFSFAGVNYTLTPPTSGDYDGITYYQPSSNTSNPSFAGGSGSQLSGLFYAPSATISVAGSFDTYAQFVADNISTAGGNLTLTGPPEGDTGSQVSIPSLVE